MLEEVVLLRAVLLRLLALSVPLLHHLPLQLRLPRLLHYLTMPVLDHLLLLLRFLLLQPRHQPVENPGHLTAARDE